MQVLGTGDVVAGNGEVEDAILDAFGLLQLTASIGSDVNVEEGGDEQSLGNSWSPLKLPSCSLVSEAFIGLDLGLISLEGLSLAISSSIFDFTLLGLTEDGLGLIMRNSVDGTASNGGGLVETCGVLVGDVSPIPTTVLEVGERLMVYLSFLLYISEIKDLKIMKRYKTDAKI